MRTYLHWNHILGQPWQWPVLNILSELDCFMKLVPQVNFSRNPLLSFFNCFKKRCRTWITEEWIRFVAWALTFRKILAVLYQKQTQGSAEEVPGNLWDGGELGFWYDFSLNNQICRAGRSATVWWKWHTIKELEGIACSQETASGQKLFT